MSEAHEKLPLFQHTDQLLHIKLVLRKLSGGVDHMKLEVGKEIVWTKGNGQ